MLERQEAGVDLRRQAVLFRTTHHSEVLQVELTVRNIPFVLYGGLRFLEAAHVKDLVAALRLVENPADELAWFRVLQLVDGVGPALARRTTAALRRGGELADAARRAGCPAAAADVLAELATRAGRGPGDRPARAARRADRRRCGAGSTTGSPPATATPPPGSPTSTASSEAAARPPASSASSPSSCSTRPSSTGDLAGPPHLDDDFLTLSTIHSAKGAEWDVVHLIHLADGVPARRDLATGRPEEIEEERRLLHVAMTRARDDLWLHVPAPLPLPPPEQPRAATTTATRSAPGSCPRRVVATVDERAAAIARARRLGPAVDLARRPAPRSTTSCSGLLAAP